MWCTTLLDTAVKWGRPMLAFSFSSNFEPTRAEGERMERKRWLDRAGVAHIRARDPTSPRPSYASSNWRNPFLALDPRPAPFTGYASSNRTRQAVPLRRFQSQTQRAGEGKGWLRGMRGAGNQRERGPREGKKLTRQCKL